MTEQADRQDKGARPTLVIVLHAPDTSVGMLLAPFSGHFNRYAQGGASTRLFCLPNGCHIDAISHADATSGLVTTLFNENPPVAVIMTDGKAVMRPDGLTDAEWCSLIELLILDTHDDDRANVIKLIGYDGDSLGVRGDSMVREID